MLFNNKNKMECPLQEKRKFWHAVPFSIETWTSACRIPSSAVTRLYYHPKNARPIAPRYQQLNQEYVVEDDLDLFIEDDTNGPPLVPRPSIIQDFSNSSLYYKQDGRVLMKLPKDKVRLVMDPELGEPGILSACTTLVDSRDTTTTTNGEPQTDISYILTVPPDIYRKVVLELAHSHTTFCSSCFESEDRVSIQVAIGLLIAILLLLFINVIIYPGD
jgi:hypothetical protein